MSFAPALHPPWFRLVEQPVWGSFTPIPLLSGESPHQPPCRRTREPPMCPFARVKRRYGFRPPKLDGGGKAMPSSRMPSGECRARGKPGTAIQFQRRELVAVPVLRLTHRWTRKRPRRCFGWRRADRPVQGPGNARPFPMRPRPWHASRSRKPPERPRSRALFCRDAEDRGIPCVELTTGGWRPRWLFDNILFESRT